MFEYYENCGCGASFTYRSPISDSYERAKMVTDWRESHRHDAMRSPFNPIGPATLTPVIPEENEVDN